MKKIAKDFSIAGRAIGLQHPPFIIAEMSGNHNQSLERALEIVDSAAAAGAHALKLQTYTADTMTMKSDHPDFTIRDSKSLWNGRTLYDLYSEAHTPWEWHEPIMKRAREKGVLCFSTPFDDTAVDFLESLDAPCYKIASFENTHLPLIRKVARTGKPMIVSTGMASVAEIDELVREVRGAGGQHLVLLKCTSTYPATPINTNLLTIPHLRELFGTEVGLSDHTMGIGASIASVALGATVIEKHFTLSRADGGVDSAFSIEPHELKALVVESERAWQALGVVQYGCSEAEQKSLQFRRSIFAAKDIKPGEVFSQENLKVLRPASGLPPKFVDFIVGRKAGTAIKKGSPLTWEMLFG